jgi:hypothetical protein
MALQLYPYRSCYAVGGELTTTWRGFSTTRTGAEKFSRRCKFSTAQICNAHVHHNPAPSCPQSRPNPQRQCSQDEADDSRE